MKNAEFRSIPRFWRFHPQISGVPITFTTAFPSRVHSFEPLNFFSKVTDCRRKLDSPETSHGERLVSSEPRNEWYRLHFPHIRGLVHTLMTPFSRSVFSVMIHNYFPFREERLFRDWFRERRNMNDFSWRAIEGTWRMVIVAITKEKWSISRSEL